MLRNLYFRINLPKPLWVHGLYSCDDGEVYYAINMRVPLPSVMVREIVVYNVTERKYIKIDSVCNNLGSYPTDLLDAYSSLVLCSSD